MENWLTQHWIWLLVIDIVLTLVTLVLNRVLAFYKRKIAEFDREVIVDALKMYSNVLITASKHATRNDVLADELKHIDQIIEKLK